MQETILADFNGDGVCDTTDLARYSGAWKTEMVPDELVMYPTLHSGRGLNASGTYDTETATLCDIGHQGLPLDKEFGADIYYNRARYLFAELGHFGGPDPSGYIAGMGLFEYERSSSVLHLDAFGFEPLTFEEIDSKRAEWYSEYISIGHVWLEAMRKAGQKPTKRTNRLRDEATRANKMRWWWRRQGGAWCPKRYDDLNVRFGVVIGWEFQETNNLAPSRIAAHARSMTAVVETINMTGDGAGAITDPYKTIGQEVGALPSNVSMDPPESGADDLVELAVKRRTGASLPDPTKWPGLSRLPYVTDYGSTLISRVKSLRGLDKETGKDTDQHVWVHVQCYECKCGTNTAPNGSKHKFRRWTPDEDRKETCLTNIDLQMHIAAKAAMNHRDAETGKKLFRDLLREAAGHACSKTEKKGSGG
jgi:hypothetical protein